MGYVGWQSEAERTRRSELQARVDAETALSNRIRNLETFGGSGSSVPVADLERRVKDLEKRVKKLEARKVTKNEGI